MSGAGKPEAIIFDWDNTLVDNWEVISTAMNATLTRYGMAPWTVAETTLRVRKSLRDGFPILFGEHWREARKVFYENFEAFHLEKLVPLLGAEELLADLTAQGIYLGVVSNKQGSYLRREAEYLGWEGFFGKIVGANDAENDKPAPDPVHLALSAGPLAAGAGVWFVGDADIDMECAINADCVPVLLRKLAPASNEFKTAEPVYHVVECRELGKLINSM